MWNIGFFHTAYLGGRRAACQRALEIRYQRRRPVRQDFHGAVGQVADPAAHAQPVGFTHYEPAKPHALHDAPYQVSHHHDLTSLFRDRRLTLPLAPYVDADDQREDR